MKNQPAGQKLLKKTKVHEPQLLLLYQISGLHVKKNLRTGIWCYRRREALLKEIFPEFVLIFKIKFSIILNKLNILYKKQETLTFMTYYRLFISSLFALYGTNNNVSQCKSMSNRKEFEKTKPIFGGYK